MLEVIYKELITPTFDEDDATGRQRHANFVTLKISILLASCRKHIRSLVPVISDCEETPDEERLRRNAQVSLATALQEQVQAFRRLQSGYLERVQATESGERSLAGNRILGLGEQEQLLLLRDAEEQAQARSEVISGIAQSIQQLAEIVRDMHTLILDQGTILDRIDHNIEQAVMDTDTAATELKQADRSGKAHRKKLWILVLIFAAVATTLIIYTILRHVPK